MNKFNKLLVAVGLFAMTGIATAVPITGSIGFTGAYTLDNTNFSNSTTVTPTVPTTVNGITTGSYAAEGISDGDSANYSAFIYNPITTPVSSLWTVGNFTFDLTSMTVDFQSANNLVLSGSGMVSSTNTSLDSASATWNFSANSSGANFTWSSSSDVPAPGIALVMAIGLMGISVANKMRKSA